MPPSASMLTTDGHSVDPYGPGIHFGWPFCASVYATRLFVVPRSIPTIRPMPRSNLRQLCGDVRDQIPDVGAAIQQLIETRHDLLPRRSVPFERGIPFLGGDPQFTIHLTQLFLKTFLRCFEPRFELR